MTKNSILSKDIPITCNNSKIVFLRKHNLLPPIFELTRKSQLHSIICNNKGVPDYLAINIYYDTLRSWHSPNKMKNVDGEIIYISKLKTKGIYLAYKELAKTHGCSSETIRRKLVKLENLGLIQRSYKHKETVTTKSYNQLIIYVWKQTPYFYNKHGIEQSEALTLKPQTNHEYITEKYNIDYHSQVKEIKAIANDRGIHKEEDTKELIEPFNKLKDRSRANFVKNSFGSFFSEKNSGVETKNEDYEIKEKENRVVWNSQENQESKENLKSANKISPEQSPAKPQNKNTEKPKETIATSTPNTNGFLGSGKYLHEVLDHLTDEMCSLIRTKCGKDFTNKAIREIAKSVSRSKKGAKAFFYHIKGFIAYLAKILIYEKRDPVKISGTNYYITANQTDSEKEMREQERYLTDIEYSLQVSPEWHLKKKLAATLQRSKAYNILTSWKNLEITKEGIAKLSFTKPIFLTEIDKKVILSQIKATHERVGGASCNSAENDEIADAAFVDSLEIAMPEGSKAENFNQEIQGSQGIYNQTVPHTRTEEPPKREGVWGKIRETFASYLPQGDAIDKSWTAKLEAKIDESSNTIHLQAPSVFIRDWIESNYKTYIEKASLENGFELRGLEISKIKRLCK